MTTPDLRNLTVAQLDSLREKLVERERQREWEEREKRYAAEQEYQQRVTALAVHPWFDRPQWEPHAYRRGAYARKLEHRHAWRDPPSVSDWQRGIRLSADGRDVRVDARIDIAIEAPTADESVAKFCQRIRDLAADMMKTAQAMEDAAKNRITGETP